MIRLDYTIKYIGENTLFVKININENLEKNRIIIVCAGINISNLNYFDGINFITPRTIDEVLYINKDIKGISYIASLGNGGKHGYQGMLNNDYGAFELSRAVALPYPQNVKTKEPISFECNFAFDLPQKKESFSSCIDNLYDISKLRKTSIFYTKKLPIQEKIKLYMQNYDEIIHNRTMQIVSYYENLFGFSLSEFELFILNNEEKQIFGGAGADNAAFSMDNNKERDFELLAHRLFHAFFAKTEYAKEYFSPPYTFIEEGFASLYEILATKNDPKNSIYSMYKRYLFYYFAKPGFKINAKNEASLQKSPWLIEFLHYTLAPLIMYSYNKAFESCPAKSMLDKLEKAGLLTDKSLFLSDFEKDNYENEIESIKELNYFELVISSWKGTYEKTELLNSIEAPKTELEHKINNISESLYKMIKSAGRIT